MFQVGVLTFILHFSPKMAHLHSQHSSVKLSTAACCQSYRLVVKRATVIFQRLKVKGKFFKPKIKLKSVNTVPLADVCLRVHYWQYRFLFLLMSIYVLNDPKAWREMDAKAFIISALA